MSIDMLLEHSMNVQRIPAVPARDSSGGIVDTAGQWSAVLAGVPCAIFPVSAAKMADFAIAGESVTHTVVTLQAGVLLGDRLEVIDTLGTTYLRVVTVKTVRGRGTIETFFEIAGEEIRLQ